MLKKFYIRGLSSLAMILTFVASSGFSVNSIWKTYEPNLPKSLKQ